MKKIIAILTLTVSLLNNVKADEGMWLLSLLEKLNYKDMQAKGLRLTPEQLYSVNNSSLKDACIWFNGGCTGEIISKEGLVLTNHHCGYDAIADLSTTQDNILDNGFWAKTKAEERKPLHPMSVTRVVRVDDITSEVFAKLKNVQEKDRSAKLQEIYKELQKKATENTHYEATCREMFKGNAYYLFVMEKFTDIRLVGTPPQNIGKFGGETDNWMWPRHTGDFSMFRIYTSKENKPADYSPENVPYKPLYHLSVSLKGVKEGDFAMIIGFPGRTNRYEFSQGVALATDLVNPNIVNLRDIRLKAWKEQMVQDEATRLLLSSDYASISNYWKYYHGEALQLKKNKVFEKKDAEEYAFGKWAAGKEDYKTLLHDVDKAFAEYKPYALQRIYINECIFGSTVMQLASYGSALDRLYTALNSAKADKSMAAADRDKKIKELEGKIDATAKNLLISLKSVNYTDRIKTADKKIFAGMMMMYYKNIPKDQWPEDFVKIASKIKKGNAEKVFADYTEMIFAKSMFASKDKLEAFLNKPSHKKILADPGFKYMKAHLDNYINRFKVKVDEYNSATLSLGRTYIKGLMEMYPDRIFYPDANSSQRLTYGTVRSYSPSDAVHYDYITTLDGVIEKYVKGDYEFDLPARLIELWKAKDFGRYAMANGKLPVGFLTDNDITGGNSGSPVMNGDGHIIGLAFDGNWEAMSGNIHFDEKLKRTISVDIRYVLWLIDKFGGAAHIVNEMTLVE